MRSLEALRAEAVIDALGLQHLDGEGVWFTVLWRTERTNSILCLLTPDAFSALHRLTEDETWVHSAGAPVEMLVLHPDGTHRREILGPDAIGGQALAVHVPTGSWQGARTVGDWSLVVCSVAPPYTGFELAGRDLDLSTWPEQARVAEELIRG